MAYKKKAIPEKVRREVIERDRGICRYCGKPGRVSRHSNTVWIGIEHEIDHVLPECLGGEATYENLVIACRHCNRTKSSKTLEESGMTLLPVPEDEYVEAN